MPASPYNSLRNYFPGWGETVVLDHNNVEVALPLHAAAITGTAPAPVLTRAAANKISQVSTGDGTEVTYFQWQIPLHNFVQTGRGYRVKSIRVLYTVATAAITDIQVALANVAIAADGQTVTAVTGTYDAAHNTTAERKAEGDHSLLWSVTTPTVFSTSLQYPVLEIQLDTLNTAVTTLHGVIVTYELLTP